MTGDGSNIGAGAGQGNPGTLLGGGGDGGDNNAGNSGDLGWRGMLPAEYQSNPSLAHYPDLGTFVKSHLEQEKLIGRDKIVLPNEKDGKEVWDKYYNSIGRPATADEYSFNTPEDWPSDFPIDENSVKAFREFAHENGMPKQMAEKAYEWYLNHNKQGYTDTLASAQQGVTNAVEGLQKQWGTAYQQNLDIAKRTVQQFDKDGKFANYLEQSGLGNDPTVIQFMHQVGSALLEDNSVNGFSSPSFNMSQSQAAQELDGMYTNENYSKIMLDVTHPQHQEMKLKAEKLAQIAYPTRKG